MSDWRLPRFFFLFLVFVTGRPYPKTVPPNTVYVTETDYHIVSTRTSFQAGVRYHFVVTNASPDVHEFMIGPQMPIGMSMQDMDKMSMGMIESIAPNQTKTLNVIFPQMPMSMSGMDMQHLEFSCHLPGHYEAGMLLPITMTGMH
jgi:uncharacterized cupredoxin-like copper-binding protein